MLKCPKCDAEITFLHGWEKVWEKFEVHPPEEGVSSPNFIDTKETVSADEPDTTYYSCPECGEDLDFNYGEVLRFLTEGK